MKGIERGQKLLGISVSLVGFFLCTYIYIYIYFNDVSHCFHIWDDDQLMGHCLDAEKTQGEWRVFQGENQNSLRSGHRLWQNMCVYRIL